MDFGRRDHCGIFERQPRFTERPFWDSCGHIPDLSTVKQILTLAGAQIASAAESTVDNLGIFISNATGVFATGTGVLKVRLLYTVVKT